MHKISSPSATSINEFTDGDEATGILATEVWSKWLNTIQRELIAILTAAGINPDDSVDNQVLAAIMSITGPKTITLLTAGASATYNKPANCSILRPTCIGAGGGGGGTAGSGASTGAASSAGGGGGWTQKLIRNPASSYTYTIGAGGPGAAAGNNNGESGGTTNFTDGSTLVLSATGGAGGSGLQGTSGNPVLPGAEGGAGSGGDINGKGTPSFIASVNNGAVTAPSISGFCPIIGGGVISANVADASNASNYGEGGGSSYQNNSTANCQGGDGFQGLIIIEEFYHE